MCAWAYCVTESYVKKSSEIKGRGGGYLMSHGMNISRLAIFLGTKYFRSSNFLGHSRSWHMEWLGACNVLEQSFHIQPGKKLDNKIKQNKCQQVNSKSFSKLIIITLQK